MGAVQTKKWETNVPKVENEAKLNKTHRLLQHSKTKAIFKRTKLVTAEQSNDSQPIIPAAKKGHAELSTENKGVF